MAWTRPSINTIYTRIIGNLETRIREAQPEVEQVKITRVSLLGILALVIAGVLHMMYGYIAWIMRQLFPETAEDEYLDRHLALKGMSRLPASFAHGACTFTGTNGTTILAGTEVITVTGLIYSTDGDVEIAVGTATVAVTCTTSGSTGNTALSSVTMVNPLPGVDTAATLSTLPTGGSEAETTEAARQRLLDVWRQPPSGGRAYDYESWAKEVSGVTRAWAIDCYNGPSTVGIVLANGNEAVSELVKSDAAAYLDTKKVLGSILYVENIVPTEFTFTINLPNMEGYKSTDVTALLTQLFTDESEPAGTIKISHVYNAILSANVSDFLIESIERDGTPVAVADLETEGLGLPILGTITYGVMA